MNWSRLWTALCKHGALSPFCYKFFISCSKHKCRAPTSLTLTFVSTISGFVPAWHPVYTLSQWDSWDQWLCFPHLCIRHSGTVLGNRECAQYIWLEKEIATHSNILAWRIPWTEEPGRLKFMGLQRVGHNWVTQHTQYMLAEHTAAAYFLY